VTVTLQGGVNEQIIFLLHLVKNQNWWIIKHSWLQQGRRFGLFHITLHSLYICERSSSI
jgi:hypothetical protein